jgi:anti-sigma regulatory factor (Ser/Thr protein kinase)
MGYDKIVSSERLTFTCSPGTASRARRLIKSFGAARLLEPGISDMEAAVGEALANSVEHGRATEIEIRCSFDANDFIVELRDNGQGFDHPKSIDVKNLSLSPARTRGYGFQIMRGMADDVTYSDGGRRLTLKKRLPRDGS